MLFGYFAYTRICPVARLGLPGESYGPNVQFPSTQSSLNLSKAKYGCADGLLAVERAPRNLNRAFRFRTHHTEMK
jgi:hypothetical protein